MSRDEQSDPASLCRLLAIAERIEDPLQVALDQLQARDFARCIESLYGVIDEVRKLETMSDKPKSAVKSPSERIRQALEVAMQYGGIDGDHHKAWCIDQMVRRLTGDNYENFVRHAKSGADGPDTYEWNEGVAP